MKIIFTFLFFICVFSIQLGAQIYFPDRCEGKWQGMMLIYGNGILKDSVKCELTVKRVSETGVWAWRTEYLSPTLPVVKDYFLKLNKENDRIFTLDEGDGIELTNYLFDNKLYCIFETSGILLTSSYELADDNIIFEVTSGKKPEISGKDVISFPVSNMQRVIFTKTE